jgi:hypothetical protein
MESLIAVSREKQVTLFKFGYWAKLWRTSVYVCTAHNDELPTGERNIEDLTKEDLIKLRDGMISARDILSLEIDNIQRDIDF